MLQLCDTVVVGSLKLVNYCAGMYDLKHNTTAVCEGLAAQETAYVEADNKQENATAGHSLSLACHCRHARPASALEDKQKCRHLEGGEN